MLAPAVLAGALLLLVLDGVNRSETRANVVVAPPSAAVDLASAGCTRSHAEERAKAVLRAVEEICAVAPHVVVTDALVVSDRLDIRALGRGARMRAAALAHEDARALLTTPTCLAWSNDGDVTRNRTPV